MSVDYGLATVAGLSSDNQASATTIEIDLSNAAENAALNWELAWIDLGGEG